MAKIYLNQIAHGRSGAELSLHTAVARRVPCFLQVTGAKWPPATCRKLVLSVY